MSATQTSFVRWIGARDAEELRAKARARMLDAAAMSIHTRGEFLIVLAGGDSPRALYRTMRTADTDWLRWHVYFTDERCLARTDPARNSCMVAEAWLDHVPIPRDHIHTIPAELGAHAGARATVRMLRHVRAFDLVVLGLGEDGHTASLFPERDLGQSADAPDALAVLDAPKPPSERVSLSAARLSRAHAAMFFVSGESKRDAVARWRTNEAIVAASVRPKNGVDVFLDAALLEPATR